jgi:hypothetical protein
MGHSIVPNMNALNLRLPEGGRIRMGAKGGPGGMKVLTQWRLTSQNQAALVKLAELYGGTVQPWHDSSANPPNQFELLTHSPKLIVYLIPNSLSQSMEKWGGGLCQRRCTGDPTDPKACEVMGAGRDGESITQACICTIKDKSECSTKTRLSVLFPELPPLTWRLDTGSYNAMLEMPGMVQIIEMMTERQVVMATLTIEQRQSKKFDKNGRPITRKFSIPVLAPADSTEQVMSIAAPVAVRQLERAGVDPYAEIGPAPDAPVSAVEVLDKLDVVLAQANADDDVVDAEIVDEFDMQNVVTDEVEAAMDRLFEAVHDGKWGGDDQSFAVQFVEMLRTQVKSDVTKLNQAADGVIDGSIIPKIVNGKAVKGKP